MEHFLAPLTRAQSDALADRLEADIARRGYGLWAVELPGEADMIGFVGIEPARPPMPFAPAIEIGWRVDKPWWGRGLASEAARASLAFAFERLGAADVVACTAVANVRSRCVMERIGMRYVPQEDFQHPAIEAGHPLRAHVLYRITAEDWRAARAG